MKKAFAAIVVIMSLSVLSLTAFGAQNIYSYVAKFASGGAALLQVDAQSALLQADSASSSLAVSGVAAVVKASAGRVVTVSVISASGVGAIYDSATVASGVAATQVAAIPATVGVFKLDFPVARGIIINPSSSVVSVSYN